MAKFRVILPAALALAITAPSLHAQQLHDPANLTGERVSPQDPADMLPINHGAPALQQLLLKLRTRASMMLIVAHPDDEDGGMLTYESRGQGARVAMLTLTRGEGGQNLMSADFDDALGLIRTQELLAADRYMGVDQFFGTEVDFGFSKTMEETLKKWTHDRVLYDAVRAVRLYRPLVIASVFVGGPTDGHGHHQVAGEIAQEVFVAAADPKVFPEMIAEGLLPWAPLKVYARVPFSRVTATGMYDYATGKTIPPLFHNYVTGKDSTTEPTATVLIHEGDKSTALGMGGDTYVQFARRGLALQKTQIGGNVRLATAGALDIGYSLKASRVGKLPETEQSLFDGIDTSVGGIATLAPHLPESFRAGIKDLSASIARAASAFEATHTPNSQDNEPGRLSVARSIADALKRTDSLLSGIVSINLPPQEKFNLLHELRIKRVQLNNALLLADGVTLTATLDPASQPLLTTQRSAKVNIQLSNAGDQQLLLLPENYPATKPATNDQPLLPHAHPLMHREIVSPSDFTPTRPYFSRSNLEQPFYDIADPSLRNAPSTVAPLVVSQTLDDEGIRLYLQSIVVAEKPESPAQMALVVPRLSVHISPSLRVVPSQAANQRPLDLTATVRTNVPNVEPRVRLSMPPAWKAVSPTEDFALRNADDHHDFQVSITGFENGTGNGTHGVKSVKAYVFEPRRGDNTGTDLGYRTVGYPGLTPTNLYNPAELRVVPVNVKTAPHLKVAYLAGTGDTVPDYLPNLGITPTLLTPKDLTADNLKQYDAVLLGVRAYAAQSSLAGAGSKPLLDYARNGGVVIVQYNTARYGDAEAPFPIDVPGDPAHNVVEEAQPVSVLDSQSPVLTWPNLITAVDFDHWVAERGHGFAASWSKEYSPLLETHDPEQEPQKGGLLYARTGKGAYVYCALALYRQLPEGVPGAYRLLANLISLGKNPRLSR